jgi:hypothetical protein
VVGLFSAIRPEVPDLSAAFEGIEKEEAGNKRPKRLKPKQFQSDEMVEVNGEKKWPGKQMGIEISAKARI